MIFLMLVLLKIILFIILPMSSYANEDTVPLTVGENAPGIATITETGDTLKLSEVYSEGPTLVYFYPKADTPGCTAQSCNLRDAYEKLLAAGIRVIGVSSDTPEEQKAFKDKFQLPFTLLADHEGKVIEAFRVPRNNGKAKRQTLLILGGIVVWRDLEAQPVTQAQDALAALISLD